MAYLQAIVLGVVQGISEFLPISSDGHLIVVPALLHWQRFGLGFDVMLHLGTLLATVVYFRRDLARMAVALVTRTSELAEDRRLAWLVIAATIPSALIALALEGFVERVETLPMALQVTITGAFLLLTALLITAAELGPWPRTAPQQPDPSVSRWKGIAIGVAQGFAVAPGLSRSGTTIASGIWMRIDRETAARFSFLLSVPIIAAATAKKLLLDVMLGAERLPPAPVSLLALAVTAVVGYAAISFLLPYVKRHSLLPFAAYTAVVGLGIILAVQLGILVF